MYLYLIPIAWLYVSILMSVAEATATNGSVLGAIITFTFYGLLPVSLILYFIGIPVRQRARQARDAKEMEASHKTDQAPLP